MDITPDELSAFLLVLKDAGVRRAKVGGVLEVEFEAPPAEIVEEREVEVPRDLPPLTASHTPGPTGYARLFGGDMPKFKPVTEPTKPQG